MGFLRPIITRYRNDYRTFGSLWPLCPCGGEDMQVSIIIMIMIIMYTLFVFLCDTEKRLALDWALTYMALTCKTTGYVCYCVCVCVCVCVVCV